MIGENNNKSNILEHFKYNNRITTDPIQLSNIFCNVFTTVGTDYANAIPQHKESLFSKYLLNCRKHNPISLSMSPTDINESEHILTSLHPKTSSGYDNFSPRLMKLLGEQIAFPITI
jgi:hypothetical protein